MKRWGAGALLVAAAVFGAPVAGADPEIHVPYCSGDETPTNNNCQYPPDHRTSMDGAPGANPDIPLGLTPLDEPAV
ncbi:hypothetical protein [Mycobacterium sp. DL592]|uniref:hypothetical protein n=1 Tax=Mycobacterium sp. DL592 TaxID=2675524 RepID=UPI00141F2B1C|nr:hypothetical protein [Mycobacterium sp. DL592]